MRLCLCKVAARLSRYKKLLGHSDIKTTMIHAHLDDGFVTAEVKKLRI